MQLAHVTVFCFFASYAVAMILECAQFLYRNAVLRWGALGFTLAGVFAHTVYLIVRSRELNLPPLLSSPHDWLLVSAWLAIVFCVGVQLWNMERSLGIFCLPVVLLLVGASQFASMTPSPLVNIPQPRTERIYWWSLVHAAFWAVGIVGVSLALLTSLMYLVQHSRLKHKHAESPALHLFSLERLSRANWWLVMISVPLLTLGMASGLWMTYLSQGQTHSANLVSIAFGANALIWIAMACLFGWLLAAEQPTGRLVAWRTIWACGFLLITLLVIKLLSVDAIHGGGAA